MRRVFLVLLLGALFCKEVSAAQHVVGGSQGWVESADLNSWASGETFKVGDQVGTFPSYLEGFRNVRKSK